MRTLTFSVLLLTALAAAPSHSRPRSPARAAAPRSVEVEMRNVHLHMTDHVTLRVHELRGRFVPTRTGGVPNLDDSSSYVVEVDAGEVAIDEQALNALMTEHVFTGHHPPVKNLEVTIEDGLVKQEGKLNKAVDIPFKVKGAVEVTPDGKIRVHAKSIKGFGLPVKGLMKALGIQMDKVMKVEAGHGLTVDDNDFIIDPQQMLPPPHLRGKITSVRIEGDEIVQVFGTGPVGDRLQPLSETTNHIYWRKGSLTFGKLTMLDTDLELIDQDPKDPFDFSVAKYDKMLVAGYSRNLARKGVRTFMPDYDDLLAGRPVASSP